MEEMELQLIKLKAAAAAIGEVRQWFAESGYEISAVWLDTSVAGIMEAIELAFTDGTGSERDNFL